MDDDERKALVLFATETGNAEDAAERIGRQLRRWHFRTRTVAMDVFDMVRIGFTSKHTMMLTTMTAGFIRREYRSLRLLYYW
jgi:sulfite reductase alpha subunit-like flavoprotein